jgi:hypothetical protein
MGIKKDENQEKWELKKMGIKNDRNQERWE